MTREILVLVARKAGHLTLVSIMLGCGIAIAVMSEPQRQQHDPSVVDTFDPSTGTITRSNR